MTGVRALGPALLLAAALAGCTSPEATRMRGGGPGGDTGNRQQVVEMHGGSQPYWRTPRLLGAAGSAGSQTAGPTDRPGSGGAPAASPR